MQLNIYRCIRYIDVSCRKLIRISCCLRCADMQETTSADCLACAFFMGKGAKRPPMVKTNPEIKGIPVSRHANKFVRIGIGVVCGARVDL